MAHYCELWKRTIPMEKKDCGFCAPFHEDMIRRNGLPDDVFGILHDLCYHHEGRDVWDYVRRARKALTK